MAGNNVRSEFFVPPFEVRFVWPHIANKRTVDFQNKPLKPEDQYYDVTMFVPKTSATPWECRNYMYIATKLMEVVRAQPGWQGQWPGALSSSGPCRWPIADCDLAQPLAPAQRGGTPMPLNVAPDFLEKNPWARGCWRITATGNYAPRVVDQGNNDMPRGLDGEFVGFKSGDFGHVSMNCYAYVTGTGGLSFGFEGVRKTRDGEPVGGGSGRSVEQMFGTPTGQPAYGAPSQAAPPPSLPQSYAAAPSAAPPPPPPAPPPPAADPQAGWQRSPDGAWALNPATNAWEPVRAAAPPPPPNPTPPVSAPTPGYPASTPTPNAPAPSSYPGSGNAPYPSSGYGAPPAPPPGNPVAAPQYGAPPQIGTR